MIGERVKKLREEKKMSMTELADKAGVAKSYLSSLERNLQTNPSIQFLEKSPPYLTSLLMPCFTMHQIRKPWTMTG